jgi:hypothetical protein
MDREVVVNDKLKQTMKILRSSKVTTDGSGRSIWTDTIETAELELLSTQELQQIIAAGDADTNNELREVAEGKDGILARNIDSGKFEVISDEVLQEVLNEAEEDTEAIDVAGLVGEEAVSDNDADGLELVSTQKLRVILGADGEKQIVAEDPDDSGFDPYDKS